jgi:hypothetical protein
MTFASDLAIPLPKVQRRLHPPKSLDGRDVSLIIPVKNNQRYCQLMEGMEELAKRRARERKEAKEEEWTMQCYAAVFVSVTSFQVWNRVCKMARYSPALS